MTFLQSIFTRKLYLTLFLQLLSRAENYYNFTYKNIRLNEIEYDFQNWIGMTDNICIKLWLFDLKTDILFKCVLLCVLSEITVFFSCNSLKF